MKKLGYRFEYEHGDSEDRTEVWINDEAGMAVRIEWLLYHPSIPARSPRPTYLIRPSWPTIWASAVKQRFA